MLLPAAWFLSHAGLVPLEDLLVFLIARAVLWVLHTVPENLALLKPELLIWLRDDFV